jgi:hypothetical protein
LHRSVPRGTLGGRLVPAGFLIRLAGTLLDGPLRTVSYRLR